MKNAGNLISAREYFIHRSNRNLLSLLGDRYSWIKTFITTSERGLEFGAGIGASKFFLRDYNLIVTDVISNDWLDLSEVDALNSGFESNSFDYIIINQVLHHLSSPYKFFQEAFRILRPGGRLLVLDPYTSLLMRTVLRIMRHEGFNELVNLKNVNTEFCDAKDPWSANCSTAKLIFDNDEREIYTNGFRLIQKVTCECLTFLNSGGVVAKTFYIPLSNLLLTLLNKVDRQIVRLAPNLLGTQIRVALEKTRKI
jgi:SAM-dependent methyltransferase